MLHKKMIFIFITICMIITFTGCLNSSTGNVKELAKLENPKSENIHTFVDVMVGDNNLEEWHENNVITSVKWQKLKLSDEHSKSYPSLSAAFDKYNEESLTDAKALMYEFTPLAAEMQGEEYNPVYCGADAKVYLQRADNYIVSLLEGVEKYTGGVHPDYFVNGINYKSDSGEKLKLSDVLTDTKELPSILEKKITEKYSDVAFSYLKDTFSKYKEDEFTWTIDYQGITFWFSPYEIASFAVGTLSAKIWFDEYPDMFNKAYAEAPENYVMTLPMRQKLDFDLNRNDDKKDCIEIDTMLDEYGSYNMLSVTANGKTFTDEDGYAYDFDVYLAHIGDKNYIYSDASSDNDYHMFCTWDVNGDTPEIVQELSGTEVDYEYIEEGFEEGTVYKQAFNNPEFLRLETRFEILGTRGATATYKLSEKDGKPEMTDKAHTFNYGHDVKTAIPLEAELLPDMDKTELPAGTSLTPYQTDGKTFVDLKTENGSVVRLNIDASNWPITVKGIPEDECFEELLYAG